METRVWTEDEIDYLISFMYDREDESVADVAKFLNRTEMTVNDRMSKIRKMPGNENMPYVYKRWTEKEKEMLEFMKVNGRMTHKEIAKNLGRSEKSIKAMVEKMGIANPADDRAGLSNKEDEIRKMASEGYTRREIAEKLGFKYETMRRFVKRKNIQCTNAKANQKYKEKQTKILSRREKGVNR